MRAATDAMRARTFRLHGRPDLLDYYDPHTGFFFEHEDTGIVGVGTAVRIEVPPGPDQVARAAAEAAAVLAGVPTDGVPPVVVGALPFDATTPAVLVIPTIAIMRRHGHTWMIVTGREGMPMPETMPHDLPPEPWASLRVEPDPAPEIYLAAVDTARDRIASGALHKVVLARTLVAQSDHDFDIATLLERLRVVERESYVFAVRGFLGASPELLLQRAGAEARTNPLAGTAARDTNPRADQAARALLLASDKDRREHAMVVDAVRAALEPVSERLDVDPEPGAIATSKVWHLSTEVRATLRAPAPNALALAGLLHPTPAVCGTPSDAALDAIRELEPVARGLYAGLVGWMDARGDGEWAVALRCAEVTGNTARLYAGAGIIAGSDARAEFAETDAKFRAILEALGYA